MDSIREAVYAKFTEINDWEGETWRFWIPLNGNEDALSQLEAAIAETDEYELDLTPVPESAVDALVAHTGSGYMAYDNKLAGVLNLPGDVLAKVAADGDDRPLYKGGIKDYVVAT